MQLANTIRSSLEGQLRLVRQLLSPLKLYWIIGIALFIVLRYGIPPLVQATSAETGEWLLDKAIQGVAAIALLWIGQSVAYKRVPDGHVAIVYTEWRDEPELRTWGRFFIFPLLQRVEFHDTREQHAELRCVSVTKELVPITVRILTRWQIDITQFERVRRLLTLEPVKILENYITVWLVPEIGTRSIQRLPEDLGELSTKLLNYMKTNPFAAEESGIQVSHAAIVGFDGPPTRLSAEHSSQSPQSP